LEGLERRWEASFSAHDASVTEELVAEDFFGTSSGGKVGNKTTMLAEISKDKNVYSSSVSEDMTVHLYGPDVAVVTGIARESGKSASGKPFSQAYRFTDTWVLRDGKWQCVAASALAVPNKK
jgi:ketosteroid isomerase-like protein